MVLSKLENLPNEVLLNIFGYLSITDPWFSFYNLNIRLNSLLENDLTKIDLSNCRRFRFVFAYETILSHIHNLFCLKLSLKRLDGSIDSFFVKLKSHNLDNLLQSLTLINATDQSIDSIVQHLNSLSNLRSITIIHDSFDSAENSMPKIMNVNLPLLSYLKIDYIGDHTPHLHRTNPVENCSTILNIKKLLLGISISLSMFRSLLHLLPQIVSIEVILTGDFRDNYMDKPSVLQCSANLEKLAVRMNHNGNIIRFKAISNLLQELPQLRTFWYSAFICDNKYGKEYHDGQAWEQLIRTYLPNLADFRLNIGLERSYSKYFPGDVIESFCSPFWTEEKKWWFVADHPDNNADTIELYSLPPPNPDKIIFYPNARWVSNSPNPIFESVRTIGLQSRGRSLIGVIVKSRFFTNVTTIEPPREFDDDDWDDVSTVSNCINLTRVKKLIINDTTLIKALPTMTSLSILKFQYSCRDFKCFEKFSSPIFQLKELILTRPDYIDYKLDRNELTIITQLFPNLEYLQLSIKHFQDLTILIDKLSQLVYINIHYKEETDDENYIEQWMQKYATSYKLKWLQEKNKVGIWLY